MLPGFDDNQPPCLRLTVVAGHDPAARQPIACVLEQRRGTLGRAIDNDLVLPDEDGVVSRVHAEIRYHDGDYYLIDRSTNGTFLNEGQEPLERDREYPLHDGDKLAIGDFLISAALVEAVQPLDQHRLADSGERLIDMQEPEPEAETDPFADREGAVAALQEKDGWSSDARRPDWFPGGDDSDPVVDRATGEPDASSERPPVPILHHHMAQPPRASASEDRGEAPPLAPEADSASDSPVPTGYVPFADQFEGFAGGRLIPDSAPAVPPPAAEEQAPVTQPPEGEGRELTPPEPHIPTQPEHAHRTVPGEAVETAPNTRPTDPGGHAVAGHAAEHGEAMSTEASLLNAFLHGLDVPSLQIAPADAPQFMEQIGRMVRESVQGLIDTLRLRAEFKREFYVPVTSIAPVDNNLFKYSVNVDDAMSRLVSDSRSAYMGPAESTQQAFQDVAAHHLALVAGMEAAVKTLLQRFSPQALQERIGKGSVLEGVLPQYRKARMWEEFEKEYQQIAEQAADDFQEILGQNFARAYTEQIRRLERVGFGGKTPDNEQS